MNERTELIAALNNSGRVFSMENATLIEKSVLRKAAAMLERDENRQAGDALSIKCYQAQVDDLQAELAALKQQKPVGFYAGHRMTPEGTTEFFGYADNRLDPGAMLYLAAGAQQVPKATVAWYEYNADLDSWFLAYGFNPKAKTRPLVFGDVAPQPPQGEGL